MPVPVFEQPIEIRKPAAYTPENKKISGLAVFFSVVLVAILLLTSEFLLRDVNRVFNQQYNVCHQARTVFTYFRQLPPRELCDLKTYEGIRLLLHADIIVPIALISLLVLYIYKKKKLTPYFRMLRLAYTFFIVWILIRIVGETEYYLFRHHSLFGKYIILLTLIIILIYLIVYIQKKFQLKV